MPSPIMLRQARNDLETSTSETILIGDTMETDILGGVQMGYRTILVLSGSTDRGDLANYAYRPDLIVDSIADLVSSDIELASVVPLGSQNDDSVMDLDAWRKVNC